MIEFVELAEFLKGSSSSPDLDLEGIAAKAFGKQKIFVSRQQKLSQWLSRNFRNKLTGSQSIMEKLIDHHVNWKIAYREDHDIKVGKVKIKYKLWLGHIDEQIALSRLAGEITPKNNRVIYVGSGSGLWAYACASLTKREVLAVDISDTALSFYQKLVEEYGALDSLHFEKRDFGEVMDRTAEGDTLFTIACGNREAGLKDMLIKTIKTRATRALFGVSYSTCFFGDHRPREDQVKEQLAGLNITSAVVAFNKNYVEMAYVLVNR